MSLVRQRLATGLALALIAVPLGAWRLARSDAAAAELVAGERLAVTGVVSLVPRRFGDGALFTLETDQGRVAIRAPAGVAAGDRVRIRGEVAPAGEWIAGYLRRLGTRSWIRARGVISAGPGRGGLHGLLDAIRNRAVAVIGDSLPADQAALMRGFVLGDDSTIDDATAEDFKRSGLAHLLAVSGQNVVLLLAFASAILIALGVPLRRRWLILAIAVALYVPIAGCGPSIQRAGVMGLVGLLAASMERPLDRWWALYLAAVLTLAWNPLAISDVGWQLSFAAVAGIAVGARPLAGLIRERLGAGRSGARAGFAEGAAITISATLATAPLMAHHFEAVPVAALPANLIALPAVAPAMWAGMAIAAAGQVPGLPLGLLGVPAGWLVGFIEWVARTTAGPDWALVEVSLGSWWSVLAVYALIGSLIVWGGALVRRSAGIVAAGGRRPLIAAALAVAVLAGSALAGGQPGSSPDGNRPWRFETRILDVGQGDAILLRERAGRSVLVDTGYAGTGAEDRLRDLGVDRLDGLVLTHADADHAGNLEAIAAALPIAAVYTNALDRRLIGRVRALGLQHTPVAAGDKVSFGQIRLDVIWPRPGSSDPGDEPNDAAVVSVATWRGFSALLTGDAEAETAFYNPPDVDVLKVPHHGSADAGLDDLLTQSSPELAVISVGSENTYGHPTSSSIDSVTRAGVPLMRTDTNGEIRITSTKRSWAASSG